MINNMRMQEIAEVLASRIAEHDQDFAREVLIDELDMEDEYSIFLRKRKEPGFAADSDLRKRGDFIGGLCDFL